LIVRKHEQGFAPAGWASAVILRGSNPEALMSALGLGRVKAFSHGQGHKRTLKRVRSVLIYLGTSELSRSVRHSDTANFRNRINNGVNGELVGIDHETMAMSADS
jgi:hypothetical protein